VQKNICDAQWTNTELRTQNPAPLKKAINPDNLGRVFYFLANIGPMPNMDFKKSLVESLCGSCWLCWAKNKKQNLISSHLGPGSIKVERMVKP
jgi:hypothetical protein